MTSLDDFELQAVKIMVADTYVVVAETSQKGLHKQLPSEVINALACYHCFCCWKRQNGLEREQQHWWSLVNCLRRAEGRSNYCLIALLSLLSYFMTGFTDPMKKYCLGP